MAEGEQVETARRGLVRVTARMHGALQLLRPALVQAARDRRTLTYGEAAAAAGNAYLARGMGPLLDVVRVDCDRRNEPPLDALVVRTAEGEVGQARLGDAEAERQAVYTHWRAAGRSGEASGPATGHASVRGAEVGPPAAPPLSAAESSRGVWEAHGTSELLATYAAILAELRRREVVRSNNAPAGDYAEWLASRALGGTLVPPSVKSYDVELPDGRRIQVKARVVSEPPTAGQLQTSFFRSWDFDAALLVLLRDTDYAVLRAALLPVDVVRAVARHRPHVNGAAVVMTADVLDHHAAHDVTYWLRGAAESA